MPTFSRDSATFVEDVSKDFAFVLHDSAARARYMALPETERFQEWRRFTVETYFFGSTRPDTIDRATRVLGALGRAVREFAYVDGVETHLHSVSTSSDRDPNVKWLRSIGARSLCAYGPGAGLLVVRLVLYRTDSGTDTAASADGCARALSAMTLDQGSAHDAILGLARDQLHAIPVVNDKDRLSDGTLTTIALPLDARALRTGYLPVGMSSLVHCVFNALNTGVLAGASASTTATQPFGIQQSGRSDRDGHRHHHIRVNNSPHVRQVAVQTPWMAAGAYAMHIVLNHAQGCVHVRGKPFLNGGAGNWMQQCGICGASTM